MAAETRKELPAPLAPLAGKRPAAPDWFQRALQTPFEDAAVEVEGAEVVYRTWGERGAPGLILIHGGAAHKEWWDAIAPFLAVERRVVALDLTGMGASGWREEYHMELYAREVRAAGEAGGAFEAGAPFVAGHSFGGFVTIACALEFGGRLAGAAVLDSPVREPEKQRTSPPPRRGGKVYPSLEAALARFRLLPHQPCENMFLLDHIARNALREVSGPDGAGWTWKFDPNLWPKMHYARRKPAEILAALKCPMAFIRGAQSALVTDEVWGFMRAALGGSWPMVSIPESQHHLILDQPLAVAAALEALFASGWGRQAG